MIKRETYSTLSILCVTFFISALPLQAQQDTLYEDSLCEFTWQSDINNCQDTITCIWVDSGSIWNDTIFSVPYNITHIAREGLEICLEDINLAKPADIIYIMDLSASMLPSYNPSGDPNKVRDDALEAGFNYQYNNFRESHAGYIGFGSNVVTDHLLPPVNVFTGYSQLQDIVNTLRLFVENEQDARGTNYEDALDTAISWLQNSSICPHEVKAIIFISDGDPNPGLEPRNDQVNYLANNKVPVHGIFLSSTAMGQDLDDLANQTGGTATLVNPNDPDALATVILQIIQMLNVEFVSKGMALANQNTSSVAAGFLERVPNPDDDSTWIVILNKPIALQHGVNELDLSATFGASDTNVYDTILNFHFYIDVSLSNPYTSVCYNCWYRTQMDVFVNNVTVDTLTWQNNEYTIKLFYYGSDTLDKVDITARTVQKGDLESIIITDWTYDGEKFIFEKTVPFAVITGNPTQMNGTTEADFEDTVTFYWEHPTETMDTAYTDVIVSAPPNRMEIWDQAGDPATLPPSSQYPPPPGIDTLTAGVLADLYAKVFAYQKWLEDYETDPNLYKDITWAFVDSATGNPDPTIGTLGPNNVAHTTFLPIKAHHIIKMTATLSVAGLNPISETVNLFIQPGPPDSIYVEATNDMSQADLNNPTQNDPYVMPGNITTMTKYGIIRDSLGNWIEPATQALWNSDNTQVVTVTPGPDDEVVINKGTLPSGETVIRARQGTTLKGSAKIETQEYVIDSLRIVYIEGSDTIDIENLVMSTNEDTLLKVLGRRNDFKTWLLVDADWAIVPDTGSNVTETPPPQSSKEWEVKPAKPATGIIHVQYFGETDTTDFTFTVGAPLWVEFKIITHDSLLIAGQPIEGEVIIRNQDGPVPGLWEYPGASTNNPAYYTDICDSGRPGTFGYIPYGKTEDLLGAFLDSSFFDDTVAVKQKFYNGKDTLTFIIYNTGSTVESPEPDPHKLTVYLDALSALTKEFIVKPDSLDSIELKPYTVPTLTPSDPAFYIYAYGYDQYENYLPEETFAWSNDSSLFDFNINVNGTQVFIDPSDATDDQEGWIYANGISNPNVQNKIYIKIMGPKPKLMLAVTDDLNGNGYLDLIHLTFDKPFSLPPGYDPRQILIQKSSSDNVFLNVDSMTVAPFSDNKKFDLHLSEDEFIGPPKDTIPHSAWTPELTINDLDSIHPIIKTTCSDGAPPVVWKAIKHIKDAYDRKKDIVTIMLSEKFYHEDQSPFHKETPPHEVFNIWTKSNSTFKEVDSMLIGINQFNDQKDDWTTFKMTNGANLNTNHYVNINHLNNYVADYIKNIPYATNQKVQVIVKGQTGDINISPIPIIPSNYWFNQLNPNNLSPISPDSINWMIQTQGGTMITIDLIGAIDRAEAKLMVFDAVANLVFSKATDENFIDELSQDNQNVLQQGAGNVTVSFYWSGCSSSGMKAAPGIYRLILFLIVHEPKESAGSKKYGKNVAVGR